MSKKKLLFVCMGNICRSPAAEGVMKQLVSKAGLDDQFEIDSAGTLGYHEGELPDQRMREHAKKRGYLLNSRARPFIEEDFEKFDLILCADDNNFRTICNRDTEEKYRQKVIMMTTYAENRDEREVPDPYYGGGNGFELVMDILEDSCAGLLKELTKK